jgi:hypothetical protein
LCRLFSQITLTVPLRRTILHLGQIFFTDARTFINNAPSDLGIGYLVLGIGPNIRSVFYSTNTQYPLPNTQPISLGRLFYRESDRMEKAQR